jgi:probable HAF family extracellular repeat protein
MRQQTESTMKEGANSVDKVCVPRQTLPGAFSSPRQSPPASLLMNMLCSEFRISVGGTRMEHASLFARLRLILPVVCALVSCAAAQDYTVTDLGAGIYATGINSFGHVVGSCSQACVWTRAGGIQLLGTLFVDGPSWGAGMNDSGHVTGGSWVSETQNGAFLWTPKAGMQEIVAVFDGFGGYSINNFDQVVGSTQIPDYEGFVWTKAGGSLYLNPVLGETSVSGAFGNNDLGQVVGLYVDVEGNDQAYLWSENSGVELLGEGQANAINLEGSVVGLNSANHAFLWTRRSGMQDLGTLAGDDQSAAAAINFFGQVVGFSNSNTSYRAFLWTPQKGMLDLNELIPPDSGWTLSYATGLNVSGQIVGNGELNGEYHGFLLTPKRHGAAD